MNELKTEDVMRALECCTDGDCYPCPYGNNGAGCRDDMISDALALLREKDARIKELEEAQGAEFTCFVGEPHKVDRCPYGDELARLQKEVAEKDEEVERLKHILESYALQYGTTRDKEYFLKQERDKAITEFLERVQMRARQHIGDLNPFVLLKDIEQIAREMKGEDKK